MLYNPNWNRHDVNSVEALRGWLATKPPEESYNYASGRHCLLAQYFKAKGYWSVGVDSCFVCHGFMQLRRTRLAPGMNEIAMRGEQTFGAALGRARALVDGS